MKKMKNAGFSLVELIVVIAIMAILVGVAVPVYTGYIEKTQKAKDEQLVDEIKHAMEIAAIGDEWHKELTGDKLTGIGMIVVKEDGTTVVPSSNASVVDLSGKIESAMKETFGSNYGRELKLSYDGWTGTLADGGSIAIANSAYAKDTEGLLKTVQNITDAFAKVAVDALDEDIKEKVQSLLGVEGDLTDRQLANGMMLYVADGMSNMTTEDKEAFLEGWQNGNWQPTDEKGFLKLAADYAFVQSYVTHYGCSHLKERFSENPESNPYAVDQPMSVLMNGENIFTCSECSVMNENDLMEAVYGDANAYLAVLEQITASKDIIVNNSDSEQLYTGTSLKQYVSSYISVAELVGPNADDGDVVIVISMDQNGAVSSAVYPFDY